MSTSSKSISPLMDVETTIRRGKRHFQLTLSKENIEYFLQGCPGEGSLVARTENNTYLHIFPLNYHPASKEFKPLGADGYAMYLGVDFPTNKNTFKKNSQLHEQKLLQELQFYNAPVKLYDGERYVTISFVSSKLEELIK